MLLSCIILLLNLFLASDVPCNSPASQSGGSDTLVPIPTHCFTPGKLAVVIDAFPFNTFDAFQLFRRLPRGSEYILLVRVGDRDLYILRPTLAHAVYLGWDIGLQCALSGPDFNPCVLTWKLIKAKNDIRAMCEYDVKYYGIEGNANIKRNLASAIALAELEPFGYTSADYRRHSIWKKPRLTLADSKVRLPIAGGRLMTRKDARTLKTYQRCFHDRGIDLVGIEACLHASPSLHIPVKRKPAVVILDEEPTNMQLKEHLARLVRDGVIVLGVAARWDTFSSKRKMASLAWSLKLGLKIVYFSDGLTDGTVDVKNREVQLVASLLKRYSGGEQELKYVLSEAPCTQLIKATLQDHGFSCIAPSLKILSTMQPKRAAYYLDAMDAGSVLLLEMRQVRCRYGVASMARILDMIASRTDTSHSLQ